MRFVALETSAGWCSVALWRDGEISALEQRAENRHGELVLPMLGRLLGRAALRAADLDAVAYGSGPGSFTGLRIACGIAQGLALAGNLPVIGITSLESVAEDSAVPRVLVCLDARMGEVYYAAMQKTAPARWQEVTAPACLAPVAVSPPEGGGWLGCGSGFAVHGEALRTRLRPEAVRSEVRPGAVAVARLAAPRFAAGEGLDAAEAAPFYLRERVALTSEERRSERAGRPVEPKAP